MDSWRIASVIVPLGLSFIMPGRVSADGLPELSVEEVVGLYLSGLGDRSGIQVDYRVTQKSLQKDDDPGHVLVEGEFAIDSDGRLAARAKGVHAVYDGNSTRYRFEDQIAGMTQGAGSPLFREYWHSPAIVLDRMQSMELTPVATILEDAIGPRRFGRVALLPDTAVVQGHDCYVVEGTYDRTKVVMADRATPVPWTYKLCLAPDYGMQIVRMETVDEVNHVPMGTVEVHDMLQKDAVWVPTRAVFTSYSYEKVGGQVKAIPTFDNVFEMNDATVLVNAEMSGSELFDVQWPDGIVVRDEINDTSYVQGGGALPAANPIPDSRVADRAAGNLWWLAVVNAALIATVLVFVIRRKRQASLLS